MTSTHPVSILTIIACTLLVVASSSFACSYSLERTTRVTYADAKARTTRSNGQCIAVDRHGKAHMVWEDDRHMNREVYYVSAIGDSILSEVRITTTRTESSFPCVACDSANAYVLWEEVIGKYSDIMYVRIRDGEVVARTRLTRTNLDSSCPVSVLGPNGALHIAWHEGPFQQTAVYYGRVEGDSLVEKYGVCTSHPGAFRPDIACDADGRLMIIWPEVTRLNARLYDGARWEEEKTVAELNAIPWRISVASLPDGRWAAAWFDRTATENEVYIGFYDDGEWQDHEKLAGDEDHDNYYPDLVTTESGDLVAVWEQHNKFTGQYKILTKCYDGRSWGTPVGLYRQPIAGRYASLAVCDGVVHSVWFSAMSYSDEIYYSTLRSDQ